MTLRIEGVECRVRDKRRTMSDEEFWWDVFGQDDYLTAAQELDECFDPAWYLRNIGTIYRRVGLSNEGGANAGGAP